MNILDEQILTEFNTVAKRMGKVIRLSSMGLAAWCLHAEKEVFFGWNY